jgi:hypothetical protein
VSYPGSTKEAVVSRRSLADSALLKRLLGTEIRSGFAISDPDLVPLQRKELIARSAICALGFVLAASWGTLLPLALSVFAGWDHFARRRRSVLVATEFGLHLVAIRGQKTTLTREWTVDVEARLILRPDNPAVPLELPGWVGVIHGADIERAERSVRDGGGEPVRHISDD